MLIAQGHRGSSGNETATITSLQTAAAAAAATLCHSGYTINKEKKESFYHDNRIALLVPQK